MWQYFYIQGTGVSAHHMKYSGIIFVLINASLNSAWVLQRCKSAVLEFSKKEYKNFSEKTEILSWIDKNRVQNKI